MIEVTGNLWEYPADYRIITTNGTVKKNGQAVLGAGVAQQAVKRYPNLPQELGYSISRVGNIVHTFEQYKLFTFPVKHEWWQEANLELIKLSTHRLSKLILDEFRYLLPRPGCGNGKLNWIDVKPIVESLPNNVFVINYK